MLRIIGIGLVASFAIGCTEDASRLNALESRVTALETQLTEVDSKVSLADTRIELLEQENENNPRPRSASYAPNGKGYQTIHTDSGVFMVSLEDLKPYANGYKATFKFGNPQAIDFEDIEVGLRWGPARPADGFKTTKYPDWQKQFQEATQKLAKRLRSGSWNTVELVLAPATAEQVGQIEIQSIKPATVFMITR